MIVVSIIGLLAAIAIPGFIKARRTSRLTICLRNLTTYQESLDRYALENGVYPTDVDLLVSEGYLKKSYECPLGGPYQWNSKNDGTEYHLRCNGQHTPDCNHVCIHEDQSPTAK